MVSSIDPTLPIDGVPAVKNDLRNNLQAAKTEIEALQNALIVDAVRDFGLSPANSDVQNSTALLAMRADLLARQTAEPGRHFYIKIAPGFYQYETNFWLYGLKRFTLEGYGATLQNIHNGEGHAMRSFKSGNPFSNAAPSQTNNGVLNGHLIDPVVEGQAVIVLKTPAEAANYQIGYDVLLFGLSQQALGFPPNTYFFEYQKVLSVNAGTGQVTLEKGARYTYRDDWVESGGSNVKWGPARMIPMTSAFYDWPDYIKFQGITVLRNPNKTNDGLEMAGKYVSFKDCDLQECTQTFSKLYHFENCKVEAVLCDKYNEDVLFDNCELHDLGDGQGTRRVRVKGGSISEPDGDKPSLASETVTLDDVELICGTGHNFAVIKTSEGTRRQATVALRNVSIVNRSPTAKALIDQGAFVQFVIPPLDGSGRLLFPKDTASFNILHRIGGYRSLIFKEDGTKAGRLVTVTEDATNYIAEYEFTSPPVAGENFAVFGGPDNLVMDGTHAKGFRVPTFLNPFAVHNIDEQIVINLGDYDTSFDTSNSDAYFRIRSIEVDIEPSAPTGGTLSLRFAGSGIANQDFSLDTPGYRKIDHAAVLVLAGDVITQAPIGQWVQQARLTTDAPASGQVKINISRFKV